LYGGTIKLLHVNNFEQFDIKPNWVLLKTKNHNPPILILKHNKNFKKIIGYNEEILLKGNKVII